MTNMKELAERASKGPWVDSNEALFTQAHNKGRCWNGTVLLGETSENILLNLTFAEEAQQAAHDARFIAASRAWVPAAIEVMEKQNRALEECHKLMGNQGVQPDEMVVDAIAAYKELLNGS